MFTINAEIFSPSLCDLAEGPVWDESTQRLFWLDIKRCQVLAKGFDTAQELIFDPAQNVGCMALRECGGMILGLTGGIYLTDGSNGFSRIEVLQHDLRTRFNDGKCDRFGRFWAGSINLFPGESGIAALYCVLPDLRIRRVLDGVTNSNGLAFSEDMRRLYYIDTPTRQIDVFDIIEGKDGFPGLENRRTLVHIADGLGYPDGMTIDCEGRLWAALWGSGKVCCFSGENGELLGHVQVPVMAVSSCCFGGSDMRTLFITTAREGLLSGEETLAGNVYQARLPVPGAASVKFAG